MSIKSLYQSVSLLFISVLFISHFAEAQKKKGPYVQIDSLIKAEDYKNARNQLIAFNKQNPENSLSRFELAKIHKLIFENLYVHNFEDLSFNYDEAALLFEQARNLVTKKELKVNRAYYDEMFGKKAYTIESIQAHIDEYVQSMQKLFTRLTQLKIRFTLIPDQYEYCQSTFVKIITNYKTVTDLYLHISDEDLGRLTSIEEKFTELKNSIDFYSNFFRDDSFADMHRQRFQFTPIKGINAYRVDKKDFLAKSVKLFDYRTWAQGIRTKVAEVKSLKLKMYELDSALSELLIVEQYEEGFTPNKFALKLETWKRQMLAVDQHADKVMELFEFKMRKLQFLYREQEVKKEFAMTYPDSATRNELIGELVGMLINMNKEAKTVKSSISIYKNHQDFVNARFGGSQGLSRMISMEERYVTTKLIEWNTIRASMPAIAPIYPDSVTFAGTKVILRSAKMRIRSMLDSGYYVTEHVYPCLDSGFIVTGKFEKNKEPRLFIGKINRIGEIQWLDPLADPVNLAYKFDKVTPLDNGMTLLFAHIKKGAEERLKMQVYADTGSVIYERYLVEVPQQMYLTKDMPGVLFVKQQGQVSGMLEGFEKYEITGFRFDGGKTVSANLLLKGNVVETVSTGDGIRMVGNFLEYQDLKGQFADSRAYVRNGYNVFVANIFLSDDKESKIQPIFSLEPIAVSKVELDVDGKLMLHGYKGDFRYNGPDNIVGGEVWEALVE